jgi:hypothetical protein
MFRTVAAALFILASSTPVLAADAEPISAVSAHSEIVELVGDTDWSLEPIRLGSHLSGTSRGALLPSLYVSLAALNVYDAYSTRAGLARGAVEANRLMQGVAGNSAALWAVKGGTTAVSIFVAERLWRKHRRVEAIAVMVVSNGMMAAVAARNAAVLRTLR